MAKELRVGEIGAHAGQVSGEALRFDIRFIDTPGRSGDAHVAEVDPCWRTVRADFVPHSLSRAFFSMLFAERPDRVVIEHTSSASLECLRVAAALGFPVAIRIPEASRLDQIDAAALRWLAATLSMAEVLYRGPEPRDELVLRARLEGLPAVLSEVLSEVPMDFDRGRAAPGRFGYEVYAVQRRDHALLYRMQAPLVAHFEGCERVLDVGCGTGVFLEALARQGCTAIGVERNDFSARYAGSLGHRVQHEDALTALESGREVWDGIYCSHFIEHLPFEAVDRMVAAIARSLRPGGAALFVFPDPESIRSQLLGFWRDPEHVRFYHPELVATLAERYGLHVEYDSQQMPGRRVVPFAMEPPLVGHQGAPVTRGWRESLLRKLGVAPLRELRQAKARVESLEQAVEQLWAVNQTWAWDDNAVLRFRRQGAVE